MASVTCVVAVNLSPGTSSHLILTDPEGRFTSGTAVNGDVIDTVNTGLDFLGQARWAFGGTANTLPVRLTVPSIITPVSPSGFGGPITSGSLTITLTNPNMVIPGILVNYVNDDES